MRRYLFRAFGLGLFIAVLAAAGGYYAYAQTATPEPVNLDLSAEAAGAWLGIIVAPSTDPAGVRVMKVVKDGPAAKAGVQGGDVITAVGGISIANAAALRTEVQKHAAGETVTLSIFRAGANMQINVALEAAPANASRPDRPAKSKVKPGGAAVPFMPGLMMGGFDNNVSGSFTRIEDGNKVVYDVTFGVVTAKSASSVTIDPNGPDGVVSFPVTANTKSRGEVKNGDKAIAVRKNGELAALMVAREHPKRENRTEGSQGENKDKKRVQEFGLEAFGAFPAIGALERFPAIREKLEMHMPNFAERVALEFVH